MIKRLRRKFILINLLLVGLVLAVVFILFVGANVRRLAGQSDAALRLALSWQEGEGPPRFEIGGPPPEEREPDGAHRFSLIPVFVVTVKDGAITGLNDGGQVDVSEETAAEAVEQAQSSGASQGVLRELRLRFLVERRPDGELRIAFADLGWETASLRNLSLLSLLVWALAMVGLFFVSLVLSSVALRPAERAWQQQRQFVADASHELKTPLAVIQNYGSLLQDPALPKEQRVEYAKAVTDASRRLADLIANILKLNKLENQQIFPQAETYDLGEQLRECLLGFEDAWEAKELAVEADIPDGVAVRTDRELLTLVWNNLFSNAVKFTDAGGSIHVSLRHTGTQAEVCVTDTGCGMSPETGRHIFEKFYQGDSSHATQGNGLGLALVRRVVDIVGGEIAVKSTLGKGSTFSVVLRSETNETP